MQVFYKITDPYVERVHHGDLYVNSESESVQNPWVHHIYTPKQRKENRPVKCNAFTQHVSLFILCDKQGSYCHGHLHFQELNRQPSNRAEEPHIHIFLIHDHGFGLDHYPVPTLVSLVHGSLTPKGRGTHPGTVKQHMCFISASGSSLAVL